VKKPTPPCRKNRAVVGSSPYVADDAAETPVMNCRAGKIRFRKQRGKLYKSNHRPSEKTVCFFQTA